MSDLKKLKAVADECERAFEAACSKHYPEGKWGYFRAIDREEHIPSEVQSADEKHLAASREFYSARDGERGFLGKYGAQAVRYSAELCKEMKERLEGVREEIRRSLENLCDDCFGVQFLDDFSDDIERTLDRVKVEEAGNATQA